MTPEHAGPGRCRGLALIVAVGILGVLAVLTTAFVLMARLERRASQQRLHGTRALLLARSGIEDALARMASGQDPQDRSSRYGGEDWDGDGTLAAETPFERFQPGVLNGDDCPPAFALRTSFFVRHPDPVQVDAWGQRAPAWILQEGGRKGFSGRLGDEGSYALKTEDESAKICVNGGILGADRTRGWNGQLVRILGNLGNRLGSPTLGTDLMALRPPKGYLTLAQVQEASGLTSDLSPYLCLSTWTDTAVIRPNARRDRPWTAFPAENDLKKDRGPLLLEEGGRPPVNLNAVSKPVLSALLDGLSGEVRYLRFSPASSTCVITAGSADQIADAILAARPFGTWDTFEAFADSLVPSVLNGTYTSSTVLMGGDLGTADMIKANFNPNTLLEKGMPDEVAWRWMDKSDLYAWSTEGSLGPTGMFRIGSVGRVLSPDGRLLASAELFITVRCFQQLRQTTQQDFVGGRTPHAGDTSYLSLANPAPPNAIPPQRTTGAGASWNPGGGGQGLGAITYPCPMTALPGNAADFDGCVGLATVEFPPGNPLGGQLRFLHHFDDGWDADLAAEDAGRKAGPASVGGKLQTDLAQSVWPASGIEPNTLHPDGVFLQLGRSLSYLATNLPEDVDPTSDRGAICYWVKRNDREANNIHIDFSCSRQQNRMNHAVPPVLRVGTQTLAIGADNSIGILMESWAEPNPGPFPFTHSDTNHERASKVLALRTQTVTLNGLFYDHPLVPDLRWHLFGGFYDDDQTTTGEDTRAVVLGLVGGSAPGEYQPVPYDLPTGEKLLADPSQLFHLGGDATLPDGHGAGYLVHQIMDEFAISDFTDDVSVSIPAFDAWTLDRFRDGRYYKGDDGTFLSLPLAPALTRACRLLQISWTQRLPSHDRPETRMGGVDGDIQPVIPRLIDPRLTNTRLQISLLAADGTLTSSPLQVLDRPAGTPVGLTLPGFRYRVRFRTSPLIDPLTGMPDDANQPVLETPFLDDITFAWQPSGGPEILDLVRR